MLTDDAPRDGGFTLVELIVSIGILGIIFGALSAVMLGALTANQQTRSRLDETRDEQFVAAYLADDVQAATTVQTSGTARCGSGSALVEFRGLAFDAAGADTVTVVSYVFATSVVDGVPTGALTRSVCEAPATPGPSYPLTPSRVTTVARTLAASPPSVTCAGGCGPTTTAVSLTLARLATGDPFTVTGTRRTTP